MSLDKYHHPAPKLNHIYQGSDGKFVLITQVEPNVKGCYSDKADRVSFSIDSAFNIPSFNWNKMDYKDLEAEVHPKPIVPPDNGSIPEKPELEDIKELREELKELEKEIDDRKKRIAGLEKEKSGLQNELAKANDKVNKLEGEKRGLETRLKQVQEENSHLKAKVEVLEKKQGDLIKQIDQLKKESESLMIQINQLINKINQLKKENDQLIEENVKLGNTINNLRIRVDDLELENKRLKGKKLLPIVLSILLGALALAILFRVLLVSRNSDSELQREFDEKKIECIELAGQNDTLCKENIVLLAVKDSLLRVNDSIIKTNTQLTSSQRVKFKLDTQPKWVGLWMYANRKENPERMFWIDVKRAVCLRSFELRCDQTGSAMVQVFRYETGQSSLFFEQEVYLKKDVKSKVALMDLYFNQAGLYYIKICNNNCGKFVYEKVLEDWEFKQCFSDDIDILGLSEIPPKKKDVYTGVFDYGYFTSLEYCRIIE